MTEVIAALVDVFSLVGKMLEVIVSQPVKCGSSSQMSIFVFFLSSSYKRKLSIVFSKKPFAKA